MSNLPGLFGYLYRAMVTLGEEGEGWVVVTLVGKSGIDSLRSAIWPSSLLDMCSLPGILIGLNAALISIVTAWLSDMKMGYCTTGWWLSQKFCCAEISEEGAACKEWRSWGGFEPFQYIAYVLFAVSACSLRPTNYGTNKRFLYRATRPSFHIPRASSSSHSLRMLLVLGFQRSSVFLGASLSTGF